LASVPLDQNQLRALIETAERAQLEGNPAEAERLLSVARGLAPEHAAVLAASGVQSLRSGKAAEARDYLRRAIESDPRNPAHHLNLASSLRELKDEQGELEQLDTALALNPYFFYANFQKGAMLQMQGKKRQAARAFHLGLSSMRPGEPVPPGLQAVVRQAQQTVREEYDEFGSWVEERLRNVRDNHSAEPLDRVDDCLGAFLGKKRIYNSQPTLTHFPRLPAIPFFDRKDFPWLPAIEAATADMRRELEQVLREDQGFIPYVALKPDQPVAQWGELNHSRRWSALFLHDNGTEQTVNSARCPLTMAALAHAPQPLIRGAAPTAFFSRLEPQTRIPPHTGSSNTRLTVHVPLIVPPGCGFRVGGDVREWQPGTALVFDDTIEHEAWNDSSEPRVILIFDIWNPLLSAAERALMSELTAGIREFFGA
jgi:aspartate beta-hydroxylase